MVCWDKQSSLVHNVSDISMSSDFHPKVAVLGDFQAGTTTLSDDSHCSEDQTSTGGHVVGSQDIASNETLIFKEASVKCLKLDEIQNIETKVHCHNPPENVAQNTQSLHPFCVDTASCDDSGHVDFVCQSEEDSSFDDLKHSMSSDESFIAVGIVSRKVDPNVEDETESIITTVENYTSFSGENDLIDDNGNGISSYNEHNDICTPDQNPFSTVLAEEITAVTNESLLETRENLNDIIRLPDNTLPVHFSKNSDITLMEQNRDVFSEENNETGYFKNCLDPHEVSPVPSSETLRLVELECLKYLVDSTSESTDTEEKNFSSVRSTTYSHSRSQNVEPKSIQHDQPVTDCKTNNINFGKSRHDQILRSGQIGDKETSKRFKVYKKEPFQSFKQIHDKLTSEGSNRMHGKEISRDLKQGQTTTKPNRTLVSHKKESSDKLCFAFVPARSSAQKALTKMKSTLTVEGESSSTDTETKKAKHFKTKKPDVKMSTIHSHQPKKSLTAVSASTTTCKALSHSKLITSMFKCQFCTEVGPASLKKIKTHLQHKHKNMPPAVINCHYQRRHRKCKYFVCSHLSCFKLFGTIEDLDNHKSIHLALKKPKPVDSFNSSSVVQSAHHAGFRADLPSSGNPHHSQLLSKPTSVSDSSLPTSFPEIRSCRVELRNLGISEVQAITHRHKREGKYVCLYCTEYVYENTLSAMKSHYIQEHEGQLMVIRDTEARRAQQPSRIYVCSSPECEYKCVGRHELDAHVRNEHSTSSCSYVYQCALCGWFSSSHVSANQHLESQHSPDEGGSLVHMQVMVDEFGQTSKKIV